MNKKNLNYPINFSHIGLTVSDIEKAYKFYTEVMGWYTIMKPTEVLEEDNTLIGKMCIDVFGKGFDKFNICHLSTGDGIGIEIFEFPQNENKKEGFNPYKNGVFHYCVKTPNIEELVEKVIAYGGKQRTKINSYYNDKPYKMVYMEDPFGNVFEIYTHSYELHYADKNYE